MAAPDNHISPSICLKTWYSNDRLDEADINRITQARKLEDLSSYTNGFRRFYNFCRGSDKADAVVALFHLTHASSGREMAPHLAKLQDLTACNTELTFKPSIDDEQVNAGIQLTMKPESSDAANQEVALVKPKIWAVVQTFNLSAAIQHSTENIPLLADSQSRQKTPDIAWLKDDIKRNASQNHKMTQRWIKWVLYGTKLPRSSWTPAKINHFNDVKRESEHNYIQLVFPSSEGSQFNRKAPLLTQEMVLEIQHDKQLQREIIKQFDAMLGHWGIKRNGENFDQDTSSTEQINKFSQRVNNPTHYDHNFQRISRVLTLLKQSGFETLATNFNQFLQDNTTPEDNSPLAAAKGHWERVAKKDNLGPKQLTATEF